ncbi:thioredoxin family protein [Pseudomonas entomophila]|uniref:thioredoxin family protein n=1 Tax=Pseudomonas entomophila TaxID=312306 RepID=UPI001F021ADB|nr:thioredoxin family protein [Pseudomonas entomophila]MCG8295466.1 thioredoxin family protein [Pseudomonas entomophila]
MAVQQITEAQFEDKVLKAGKPVVVEFFEYKADGSENSSKRMSKVLDDWASSESEAYFFRMPLSDSSDVAGKYDVRSAPTLLYFSNGSKVEELIGYYKDDRPKTLLARHL